MSEQLAAVFPSFKKSVSVAVVSLLAATVLTACNKGHEEVTAPERVEQAAEMARSKAPKAEPLPETATIAPATDAMASTDAAADATTTEATTAEPAADANAEASAPSDANADTNSSADASSTTDTASAAATSTN